MDIRDKQAVRAIYLSGSELTLLRTGLEERLEGILEGFEEDKVTNVRLGWEEPLWDNYAEYYENTKNQIALCTKLLKECLVENIEYKKSLGPMPEPEPGTTRSATIVEFPDGSYKVVSNELY